MNLPIKGRFPFIQVLVEQFRL